MSEPSASPKFPAAALFASLAGGAVLIGAVVSAAAVWLTGDARGVLSAVWASAGVTLVAFAFSLAPVIRLHAGPGLSLVNGYFVGMIARVAIGLLGAGVLIMKLNLRGDAVLLTFAALYLPLMFVEVAWLVRFLNQRDRFTSAGFGAAVSGKGVTA